MENFADIGKKIKANAKQAEVNVIHPFIEAQSDKKLSIIGVYDNVEVSVVNGAGNIIPFEESEFYFGLHPSFSTDEVCLALKRGVFNDSASLEKFIDDNAHFFTLPASMSKYARALFAKTLVKMSTMFGFRVKCQNEACYKCFGEVVKGIAEKDLDYDLNDKDNSIRFLGQPSDSFINALQDTFAINDQGILIFKTAASKETLRERLFARRVELVKGKGYYSGVLPRVKCFEWRNLDFINADVMSLAVKFGRTTFSTRDAFDNSYIKKHRLLKEYIPLIEEVDAHEDALLQKYFGDLSKSNDEVMEDVNAFLAESYSTHHLSVSGNVITSDGYLILCKRGAKTIDSGGYYCSVNGQSEICDQSVKFYEQSVYEDIPTLRIDGERRIDFMGEFEREAEAELNIACPAGHWLLRGVSFLSIITSDGKEAEQRRFHFNILGECSTEYPLSQILKKQKSATEKFENSKLIGVKVTKYKNIFSRIADSIKRALILVLKSKDFVSSILALALFAISFGDLQNSEFTIKSLSSVVSIVFTVLSLILLINNIIMAIIRYSKRKGTHRKLSIIGDCSNYYLTVHSYLQRRKIKLHPIADLLLYEYIKYSID